MANIKPPQPLLINNEIDMAVEWADWLDEYNNYYTAAKIKQETEDVQVANLRAIIGREANKVLKNFNLSEAELKKREVIIQQFTDYFSPPRNRTYERYQFHHIKQQENQPFEDFLQKLQQQVKHCAYGEKTDEFLVDQIVLGLHSDNTRKKLWMEENLNLEKTYKICRVAERAGKQMHDLNNEDGCAENINVIKRQQKFKCNRCNKEHGPRSCFAFGKECFNCGGKGHFAVVCKTKKKREYERNINHEKKKVHAVEMSDDESEFQYIGSIKVHGIKKK